MVKISFYFNALSYRKVKCLAPKYLQESQTIPKTPPIYSSNSVRSISSHTLQNRQPPTLPLRQIRARPPLTRLIQRDSIRPTTHLLLIACALHKTIPQRALNRRPIRRDRIPTVALPPIHQPSIRCTLRLTKINTRLDRHTPPRRLRHIQRTRPRLVLPAPNVLEPLTLRKIHVPQRLRRRRRNARRIARRRRRGANGVTPRERGKHAVDRLVDHGRELAGLRLALLAECEGFAGAVWGTVDAVCDCFLEDGFVPAVDLRA